MKDVWIYAEQHNGKLKEVSFELLARGKALADDLEGNLCAIVMGDSIPDSELDRLIHHGADIVYYVNHPCLAEVECQTQAAILKDLAETYTPNVFLAGATTAGRTILPYLAVKLHAGLTADCTELAIEKETGNLLQTRPAIGGNIMATIKTPDHRPQMSTVRPKSMRPLPPDTTRSGLVKEIPWVDDWFDDRVRILGLDVDQGDFVSIEEADIVVAGGRGMKKRDNFKMIDDLAHSLGGQVGASRDAVDRGWASYPHQIGLSGKTISPELYIGIGISGAVQHLAGMKTSEHIVAINNDEHANIMEVADFAIVGDLFAIVPELQRRLSEREAK